MSPCRLLQQCTQRSVSGSKSPCQRDLSIDRPGQIMSADGLKLCQLIEFSQDFSVGGIPGSQNNMRASHPYSSLSSCWYYCCSLFSQAMGAIMDKLCIFQLSTDVPLQYDQKSLPDTVRRYICVPLR